MAYQIYGYRLHTFKEIPEEVRPHGYSVAYEQVEYPAVILITEYSLDRHFKNDIYHSSF